MINILNRKELMTDSSAEEFVRVKEVLKTAGIEYEVKTLSSRGVVGRAIDSSAYARANLSFGTDRQRVDFVYRIYVRKKDYDAAWAAAYESEDGK